MKVVAASTHAFVEDSINGGSDGKTIFYISDFFDNDVNHTIHIFFFNLEAVQDAPHANETPVKPNRSGRKDSIASGDQSVDDGKIIFYIFDFLTTMRNTTNFDKIIFFI